MVYKIRSPRIAPKSIFRTVGLVLLLSILVARGFPAQVQASPETTNLGVTPPGILSLIAGVGDDVFATADLTALLSSIDPTIHHFGPYPSTSPDSSTCGNNWADDKFDRHFTVMFNPDNSVSSLIEQFKDGSFLTPSTTPPNPSQPINSSPGGCQTSPPPPGFVNDGIKGKMQGYFVIMVPPGLHETSGSPYCDAILMSNANCTTTTFINTHFTPACYPALCPVTTFFFHYTAHDQGLIYREWTNASPDRGGNKGDIRSGPTLPCPNPGDDNDAKQQNHEELCEQKAGHGEQNDGPTQTENQATEQTQNQHGADLSGEDLNTANYHGYDFSGANLQGADLSASDLTGANLAGADLSCANLSGANLIGANLLGAIIEGANLTGANLLGVDLSGVITVGPLVCH
jgi:uncharacterized protein YjbI with pentapeptide repeats